MMGTACSWDGALVKYTQNFRREVPRKGVICETKQKMDTEVVRMKSGCRKVKIALSSVLCADGFESCDFTTSKLIPSL